MIKITQLLFAVALLLNYSSKAQLWKPQVSGVTSDLRTIVFPENNQVGYAAGGQGYILKTSY